MLEVAQKEKRNGSGAGGAPGTEGARRASAVTGAGAAAKGTGRPDPEVPEKAQRRRFSPEYKLRILEEADRCREAGEIGALLRREGLYTSNLSTWREQRRIGVLSALSAKKRGRTLRRDPQAERVEKLEGENRRLREELRKAHVIIEVQKKVARLLGNEVAENDEES
jgi:transposase